jgi:hypothetical protein
LAAAEKSPFNRQEEQRREDRLARDESAIQAQEAEESKLAKIRETRRLAEEQRLILVNIKEKERKQLLAGEQEDQCR